MMKLFAHLAAFAARATAAFAQQALQVRKFPPIAPHVGAFNLTGDQRNVLDDALRAGLRLSLARAVRQPRSTR